MGGGRKGDSEFWSLSNLSSPAALTNRDPSFFPTLTGLQEALPDDSHLA